VFSVEVVVDILSRSCAAANEQVSNNANSPAAYLDFIVLS
jgi:hypothetical protein